MPAPSPLKNRTAVVVRLINDEKSYFKQYNGEDAKQIKEAKAAKEDAEGNKDSNISQAIRAQQETLKAYNTLFDDDKIKDALEILEEELKETEGKEVDAQVEGEIEKAREVIANANEVVARGPRLP